jgi:2-hydroxy-4-carboxymuconate semialdehyde hemiacetal dehydrogenase
MKIVLAGEGAIGRRHIMALKRIDGVEVISLVGGNPTDTAAFAAEFGIEHFTGELSESLALPGVDAVVLATPTGMHQRSHPSYGIRQTCADRDPHGRFAG